MEERKSGLHGLIQLVRRRGRLFQVRDEGSAAGQTASYADILFRDMVILGTQAKDLMGTVCTRIMARTSCPIETKRPQSLSNILLQVICEICDGLKSFAVMMLGEEECCSHSSGLATDAFPAQAHATSPVQAPRVMLSDLLHREEEAARLIDSMIVYASGEHAREKLRSELKVISPAMINMVAKYGVKILILSENDLFSDVRVGAMRLAGKGVKAYGKYDYDRCRGVYSDRQRMLLVQESALGRAGDSVAIHEFAHALDHAISYRQRLQFRLSVRLWYQFAKDRAGLVSSYSEEDPMEYFAESVEAYFSEARRAHLHAMDPRMYSFLEELFAR